MNKKRIDNFLMLPSECLELGYSDKNEEKLQLLVNAANACSYSNQKQF